MKVNSANVKHISLQPGMYVFNYVRSLTPNSTPVTVFSKRPHFGSGTMSCLYSNEKVDGQLSAPGECVVIRVGQNSLFRTTTRRNCESFFGTNDGTIL